MRERGLTEEMRRRTRRRWTGRRVEKKRETKRDEKDERGEGKYSCASLWLFIDDIIIMNRKIETLSYMSKFSFIFNTNKNKPH